MLGSCKCCNYSVGFYNLNSNGSQWLPTISALSAPDLSTNETCSFELEPFGSQQQLVNAVQSADIDFVLVNPGLMVCLQTQFGVTLVAGLVNNLTNHQTTVYGGDVLVKSTNNITSCANLKGLSVISAAPYSTGLFQVQARALNDFGLNVFENIAVLGFNSNQSAMMQQLLQGGFDAAFLRADMVNTVLDSIGEPYDSVKILNSFTPDPNLYPYQTTGNYLVPEWTIGALTHVDQLVRTATAQALFAIQPNDPGPQRQGYYRWTIPFNYFALAEIERSLGILDAYGTCIIAADDDYYAYIKCPPDTIKLTREDVAKRCAMYSQCNIDGTSCICFPCFRPVHTLLFGLKSPVFWLMLVGLWIVVSFIGWSIQIMLDSKIILEVPRSHLEFPDTPEIIGESRYGNIIKATLIAIEPPYKKVVAIHRMIKPNHYRSDTLFGPSPDIIDSDRLDMTLPEVWYKLSEACRLAHPHLLRAEGVVKTDNEIWFVMEYPEAGNLYDLLHNQTLKVDMGTALRLLKEVAFALQYMHAERPPVCQRVSVYNVWLDNNRISKIMLSDNYLAQSKSVTSDIDYFGEFMADVIREIPKDTSQLADLDTSHHEAELLIHQCRASQARKRPKIGQVIERLTEILIRWQANQDKALLSREAAYKQETDLLHSIFPEHVARALREGKDVQPESFDCVSILFTDIVGFTNIASSLSPIKVENMLDRLYKQFDALSVEYNVFKLDTSGDAYLGVCNLHENQEDHAARIARFAMQLISVAKRTLIDLDNPSLTLNIRAGINSGPVVASVAGTRNPRYCLFGNAINLASRMESTSIAGKIQLSPLAAELVREQAEDLRRKVHLREDIQDIKGKGKMLTYWLVTD